jgi:hypothetical protein
MPHPNANWFNPSIAAPTKPQVRIFFCGRSVGGAANTLPITQPGMVILGLGAASPVSRSNSARYAGLSLLPSARAIPKQCSRPVMLLAEPEGTSHEQQNTL